MRKASDIWRSYRESGALHALVPIQAAVDDRTLLTKGGEILTFFSAQGVDADCLEPGEVDAVARRVEAANRGFDERFRIYQYLSKRSLPELTVGRYRDPVVQQAMDSRAAYLNSRGERLYTLDIHFAVALPAWSDRKSWRARLASVARNPKEAVRRCLSTAATVASLEDELARSTAFLRDKVDSYVRQLEDVLPLKILDKHAAYGVLRRLLNYDSEKAAACALKYDQFIDFFAADSTLEAHRDHLRLDDYYVQVFTVKDPPAHTFAHLLRGIQGIAANYIVASEWQREPNGSMRRLVQSKRRHFHNSKVSFANYLTAASPVAPADRLVDDGAVSMAADLGACLEALEMQGRYFGRFSTTVVLFDRDRAALGRATAEFVKVFSTFGAHLVQETYNALNAWLALLPGNHLYNLRRLWLTDANYADLSFAFGQHSGEPANSHLGIEHLVLLESEARTAFFFNLHHRDNAHTLVLGAPGSGKSFLLNVLITALRKYETVTFIFDLGGSYRWLTDLFGGAYVSVGKGAQAFAINPFCLPPVPANLQFLFTFCRGLIEASGYAMSSADERDLSEQIENLYTLEVDQRRLLTLANIVNRPLRAELRRWVEGGSHGQWFDNTQDTVTLANFQTFDFEGLDDYPDVLELLVFYILHRANSSLYDPALGSRFKVFVIDEAWRFFKHPAIRAYVTEALKTWRKKNAAMVLATQSLEDVRRSELLPVIVESCPNKLFLANPGADRAVYREVFHLNETESERIGTLIPKQQILIKRPDLAKVVNLKVDRKAYWLYTTHPTEAARRREAFEHHGLEKGLDILARSSS